MWGEENGGCGGASAKEANLMVSFSATGMSPGPQQAGEKCSIRKSQKPEDQFISRHPGCDDVPEGRLKMGHLPSIQFYFFNSESHNSYSSGQLTSPLGH